ncbi:MAG: ABC transporter ATP-binding protein [Methanocalculus sp. MSAO_Arc1]|uniref:ABC transporter ATP-binding protein n=1 Tax=Methanocalculus TaxID=71151 RepID=UPI000FEE3C41|nr:MULTISPECIES: ABC transporter ATP-binding protein [unclassified Methanocalculus]MCP1661518.1 iron complex transport system ATP-binding protein [Methanocalculus sp. AMF5]RQD81003.1 MAG: ABC transporter ATP-binding protein [Methanocalculus sp. MSAO_Arc1]
MKAVDVVDLDVRYGAHQILEEIAFSVQSGEMIGICGPNGSGKTTLLKAMSRIVAPAGGDVYYNGDQLDSLSFRMLAQRVAVVPQETAINFDYTVAEIVMMGRHPYIGRFASESREDHAICERVMRLANVSHLADMPVNQISGGERQRVLIARALAQEPDILLLDEATSHLDISHQIEILTIIRKEMEKTATISVFHDINLASCYCDRIILLKERQIAGIGRPADVVTENLIHSVYGISVIVATHPSTNRPYILPMYEKAQLETGGRRVHLVCGGGTGSFIQRELHQAGCLLSTGVLNVLDSDYTTARDLGIPIISEAPFASISGDAAEALISFLEEADMILLVPMPVGSGNLENIRLLEPYAKKTVLVGCVESFEDHTGGAATSLLFRLVLGGMVVADSLEDAMTMRV